MGGANSIIAGWRAVFRKGSTALYSVSSRYFVRAIKIGSRDVTDAATTVADGLESEWRVLPPSSSFVAMIGSVLV